MMICFLIFHHSKMSSWQFRVRGTAFLWHQVRCMTAVLFLIGQGLEKPQVDSQGAVLRVQGLSDPLGL